MSELKKISTRNKNSRRPLQKLVIGAAMSMTIVAGSVSNAIAFDDVIEEKIKILNCIGLLITNPVMHLAVCGTSELGPFSTLAPLSFEDYVAPTTPETEPTYEYQPS